jgi:hypothetical protein
MSPIPGRPPAEPDPWAWLDADPELAARVDHFVATGAYPDRASVLRHAARSYYKLTPIPSPKGPPA